VSAIHHGAAFTRTLLWLSRYASCDGATLTRSDDVAGCNLVAQKTNESFKWPLQ
jgi:hypothetical protein